jgi:hypothetical protein
MWGQETERLQVGQYFFVPGLCAGLPLGIAAFLGIGISNLPPAVLVPIAMIISPL